MSVRSIFGFCVAFRISCQDSLTDDQLRNWHDRVDHSNDKKVSTEELLHFAEQLHWNTSLRQSVSATENEMALKDESSDGFVSLEEHLSATVSGLSETAEKTRVDETAKFKAADTNGDGKLTVSEMHSLVAPETHVGVMDLVLSHSLRDADSDNSGKVSLDEFRNSGLAHKGLRPLHETDDGFIADDQSLDELDKSTQQVFTRLDTNGDKHLDKDELRDLMSGKIQRENVIHHVVSTLDSDNDKHVDVDELIKGKNNVQDSEIQDYLIMWASHRYHAAPQPQYHV